MTKILFINTSERIGGAAIAAGRLMHALRHHASARMLVRDRQTDHLSVSNIRSSWLLTLKFLWERLVIFLNNGWSRHQVFAVDIANTGTDITKMKEFSHADVIHLHWINQGFLSLRNLEAILRSGKQIVITMHDMWYFTGICHHAGTCTKYETECNHCPFLARPFLGYDLAKRVFLKKKTVYKQAPVTFVGCSEWITRLAQRSALTEGHRVVSIPNPIDTDTFTPCDKESARRACQLPTDRHLILFTSRRITDEMKGFQYLAEASRMIRTQHPEDAKNIAIVVVGLESNQVKEQVGLDVFNVDYVENEEKMIQLYNAVDLFVTPSLQENLPNTIMEAMSCGTPCVGFHIGGIPEMIDHLQNGYVADYCNAQDFADGILWALHPDRYDTLSQAARQKVLNCYSEQQVVNRFLELYAKA